MLTDDFYWFWLCNIAGVGKKKVNAMLEVLGSAREVYGAGEEDLININGINPEDVSIILESRKNSFIYEAFCNMKKSGIKFLHRESAEYPGRLKNIYDAPVALYYKGELLKDNVPTVAVIGARNCTPYGTFMAYELSKGFANMGWQVISGMAMGIDAKAHEGCLDANGFTCAVIGCGADICYPRSNIEIYTDISKRGCIITEYPMGTPPRAGQFPVRNRIISGLADVVVVVEARKKSGSLITVEHALEQGKSIFAVPGRVGDGLSEGCNWLIKMGAGIITEASDILGGISLQTVSGEKIILDNIETKEQSSKACENYKDVLNDKDCQKKNKINSLASKKNIVYSVLDLHPKSLETIIDETGLDMATVNEQILCLQLEGLAQEISKNYYCRM